MCRRICSRRGRRSSMPGPITMPTAISTCSSASTGCRIACIATTTARSWTPPAAAGIADARPTRAVAWGDADADGDPDLVVGFTPSPDGASLLRLYRNDGGKFVDATTAAGLTVATGAVRQPVWVDYDGDHDLDLFVAFRDKPNALFRNQSAEVRRRSATGRSRRPAPNGGRGLVRPRRGRRPRRHNRQHGRRCERPLQLCRRSIRRRRRNGWRRLGRTDAERQSQRDREALRRRREQRSTISTCSSPTTGRTACS